MQILFCETFKTQGVTCDEIIGVGYTANGQYQVQIVIG